MTQVAQEFAAFNADPDVLEKKIAELKLRAKFIAELASNKNIIVSDNKLVGDNSNTTLKKPLETLTILIDLYESLCRGDVTSTSERQELIEKISANERMLNELSITITVTGNDIGLPQTTQTEAEWSKISALCLSREEFAEYQENQRELEKLTETSRTENPLIKTAEYQLDKEKTSVSEGKLYSDLMEKMRPSTETCYFKFWQIANEENVPFGRSMFHPEEVAQFRETSEPESKKTSTELVEGQTSTIKAFISTLAVTEAKNNHKRKKARLDEVPDCSSDSDRHSKSFKG